MCGLVAFSVGVDAHGVAAGYEVAYMAGRGTGEGVAQGAKFFLCALFLLLGGSMRLMHCWLGGEGVIMGGVVWRGLHGWFAFPVGVSAHGVFAGREVACAAGGGTGQGLAYGAEFLLCVLFPLFVPGGPLFVHVVVWCIGCVLICRVRSDAVLPFLRPGVVLYIPVR